MTDAQWVRFLCLTLAATFVWMSIVFAIYGVTTAVVMCLILAIVWLRCAARVRLS